MSKEQGSLPGMLPELRLSAAALHLVWDYVPVHDVRSYLQGVLVQRHPEKGVLLVATNGAQMAVYHDTEGTCSSTAVLVVGKQLASECGKKAGRYVQSSGGRIAVYDCLGLEVFIQAGKQVVDDQRFVDWLRILNSESGFEQSTAHPGAMSADCMARIAKTAKKAAKFCRVRRLEAGGAITMRQRGANSVFIAQFGADKRLVVITMPMHRKAGETVLPDWVHAALRGYKGNKK